MTRALCRLVVFSLFVPAWAWAVPQEPLAAVAFMSGCWSGSSGPGASIEERYTDTAGAVMLGTTRYFRDGNVVQFEFATLTARDGKVVLLPYPSGRPSEHAFELTVAGDREAMFEAPEHDYPKRISYRLDAGTLTARIDGGADDTEGQSWSMRAVPCSPSDSGR